MGAPFEHTCSRSSWRASSPRRWTRRRASRSHACTSRTSTRSTSVPSDREQFANYEDSLLTELSDYLSEHARREGYALLSTPTVLIEEDEDLGGEFGIATCMVQSERPQAPAPPDVVPRPCRARRGSTARRPRRPRPPRWPGSTTRARAPLLAVSGARRELGDGAVVVGRSSTCDIVVDDPNVSRRHAEIRREDGAYWIVDLGSTNGLTVNGKRVERARLAPEDHILIGTTEVRFESGY